jgi:hypothetical protein
MTMHGLAKTLALGLICMVMAIAAPARAADQVLEGLSWQIGPFRLDVPRLEVAGTSLAAADLRRILTAMPASGPLSASLARLEAARVVIPEARLTQVSGVGAQTVIYSDIVLTGVSGGVIGDMLVGATRGAVSDPQSGEVSYTVGKAEAQAIDLPQMARVMTEAADPAGEALKPLFKAFTYNDYRIRLPQDVGEVTIARVVNRDARARPGREPLTTMLTRLLALPSVAPGDSANSGGDTPSREEMATIAQAMRLIENFQYGVLDVEGVAGRIADGPQGGRFAIAQMRFSDVEGQSGLALAGLTMDGAGAKLAIAELEARDFAFGPMFSAFAGMLEAGDMDAMASNLGKLIPKLGTIRLKGFNVEAPEALTGRRRGGGPPQLLRASLTSAEIAVGAQRDGVPTAIRFAVDGLDVPLPANSTESGVRDLRAMGLTSLNLSWLADLAWREADQALDIRSLSFSGRDLLTASLTGELANVTADAFSLDTALAPIAWLGATARRATLVIENKGVFEKVIANEARKAGKSTDTFRRELGAGVAIGLPALLGASEGARTLTSALARFVARPGRLDVDLTARDRGGIGVADLMVNLQNPQALFDRLDVKAAAR